MLYHLGNELIGNQRRLIRSVRLMVLAAFFYRENNFTTYEIIRWQYPQDAPAPGLVPGGVGTRRRRQPVHRAALGTERYQTQQIGRPRVGKSL